MGRDSWSLRCWSGPRHVTAAGVFNEDAFRALDLVLARANAHGVRLIIPFVDNWKWWGGRGEYAGFRGREPKDFWTDPEVISDFKKTIEYVITRKNTVTGVLYRDDKAILTWPQDSPPKDEKTRWASYRKSDRTLFFNANGKNPATLGKFQYGRRPSSLSFLSIESPACWWIVRKIEFSWIGVGMYW